jgi:hypothetical protein
VATLLLLLGASAAARSAEPVAEPQAQPAPALYIVFDVVMERESRPEGQAMKDDPLQQAFEDLAPRLKAWGRQNGVEVETALFADKKKIDLAGRVYSYLLIEKIILEARSDTPLGPKISDRKWSAQAYDLRGEKSRRPDKRGTEDFVSDGIACFGTQGAPADPGCRRAYLNVLSRHLRWLDASWSEIGPGAN